LQSYQRYIDILLRTRQEEQAFQWTQRAKARVLVDLMEAGKVETRPILTAEEKQQEVALKRRDRELTRQWLKTLGDQDTLKRQGQADKTRQEQVEKQSRAVRQQQRQLERDWDAFSQAIYLRKPQEVQMRAAHTVTLKETAALLTEEDALLEYGVVRRIEGDREREQLVLFVVTREKGKPRLTVHRLPSDVPRLAKLASAFRLACAGRPGTASERPYKDLARQIYRLLLAPAEATLKYKRHLIFGPDGPLWEIPFQAALVSQPQASGMAKPNRPQFLWERYAISYAYSATGLKAALDVRQRPNRSRANQSLLVMANPDFGQRSASASATPRTASSVKNASRASETGGSVFLRGGPLSPLPHTLTEATAIQTYFPQAMVKSGKEAQEELLKRTGGNYRYLHLATHSLLNDSAPMLSGVALAQPPPNSQEDGILTARECFDLSLNAEMVVLSACETARGARHAGEGIIGLTWALFVAGVPTQIVSQWAVDDAATARLMGGLYRSLKQGKTKEKSLREAGLALLRNEKYQHPFYWAPFVILGDWH
jgi:CHAT domain-containing protein